MTSTTTISADQNLIASTIRAWDEQLRSNSKKMFPISFFKGPKEQAHEVACALFRHVFENLLEWSPTQAVNYLTFDYIKKLNLSRAFNALIYPPEYKDRRCATFYVAILCYPELRRYYTDQKLWIMEFNRCSGRRNKYIRFDDENLTKATDKARYLLNHVLTHECVGEFKNIEDIYDFFSQKGINDWLSSYKLNAALKFFENPLDYLHQSLPNDVDRSAGRNDFMLQFTEFKVMDKQFKEALATL